VNIDNPSALHFIMQDDIFLLNAEKSLYNLPKISVEKEVLQSEPEVAVIVSAPEEIVIKFNYLGKRKKDFVILVHYPELEFIHEPHLTALENILKRKGFEVDDVAILNMAKHNTASFEAIMNYFKPQKMLLLGNSTLPAGIAPLKLNEAHQSANCTLLYSFSFDEMMDSNDNKRTFWEQMKLL